MILLKKNSVCFCGSFSSSLVLSGLGYCASCGRKRGIIISVLGLRNVQQYNFWMGEQIPVLNTLDFKRFIRLVEDAFNWPLQTVEMGPKR